ncbi:MAG: ribonuclease PH [Candidatus Sumerlaeia bacterium]|nr:ribonuclease PH [Candidatus Sumerlaeia bacterium]
MRIDGREAGQVRPVIITPNYLRFAEGSAMIEWGKNKVICAATVEQRVPPYLVGSGTGWVTAEYSMLPRSAKQRIQRDNGRGKPNARGIEIQRLIGRSLRAVVDMKAFGERSIMVDCDVVESDGGTRTASITGAFVALALAIERLRRDGAISQNARIIKDYLAAVSVGIVEGKPVVDLNYLEDSTAHTDMNVVMTGSGNFVEIQGTAEREAFPRAQLLEMLDLAGAAIEDVITIQKSLVTLP